MLPDTCTLVRNGPSPGIVVSRVEAHPKGNGNALLTYGIQIRPNCQKRTPLRRRSVCPFPMAPHRADVPSSHGAAQGGRAQLLQDSGLLSGFGPEDLICSARHMHKNLST